MKNVLKKLLAIKEEDRLLAKDILKDETYLSLLNKYGI
jgi:hypothetical protein